MANETLPQVAAAPSSVKSAAKPISAADLQMELQRAPKAEPAVKAEPVETKPPLTAPEEKPVEYVPKDEKPAADGEKEPSTDYKAGLRDRLSKPKAEAKKEEKTEAKEEKPVVETKAAGADEDVPEEQRKVLPHDKPDTAKRIKHFLKELAKKDEALAAKAKELEEAKKAPVTPDNTEELTKLREDHKKMEDDLLRYRRLHDLDSDTEFKARYVEPVAAAEKAIAATLGKYIGEPTLKAIEAAGGFGAFSRSTQTFTVTETNPETNEPEKVSRTAAELARSWLNGLPIEDAEFIRQSVGKQRLLAEERKREAEKAQAEARQYFEQQTTAQKNAQAQAEAVQKKAAEEYQAWLGKVTTETDWLKDAPIPENATAEQRKAIEDRNEFNKQLRDGLAKHPKDAAEYGDMKLAAAEAHHLRRTLGDKDAEIARLTAELTKTKSAMKTTGKAGSLLASGGVKAEKQEEQSDDWKKSLRSKVLAGNADE